MASLDDVLDALAIEAGNGLFAASATPSSAPIAPEELTIAGRHQRAC